MSSKKEHRIPIQVSRVLRLLEGDAAAEEKFKKEGKIILHDKPKPNLVEVPSAPTRPKITIDPVPEAVPVVSKPPSEHPRAEHHRTRAKVHRHRHDHDHHIRAVPRVHEVEVVGSEFPPTHIPVVNSSPEELPHESSIVEGIDIGRMRVGYFCMEVGIASELPLYAGGLGILAGDTLKSFSDLDIPVIGVSLLYRKGFFRQRFDKDAWQFEEEEQFTPEKYLTLLSQKVRILIEGRPVVVRAWLYKIEGVSKQTNPLILLDTDTEENTPEDRGITHVLYAGDRRYRLKQEAVLGIGGIRMLEALGATHIEKYHMNEGHSALLTLELYRRHMLTADPVAILHRLTVFTTHTPLAAGHDRFDFSLVQEVLGRDAVPDAIAGRVTENGQLNMTRLGLELSGHINGVAKKHGDVTREMFPSYRIDAITNGVYARGWAAEPMKKLFTRYLPDWEIDPYSLRYALSLPPDELWNAHLEAKRDMIRVVREVTGVELREDVFTVGFARRATAYKRAELLFSDIGRLRRIAERSGKGIQIVLAGKAHPYDHDSKLAVQRIIRRFPELGDRITAVYIPDYNMRIASYLVSGVDLWLNTPARPQEASGTSGMKAAINGIPQLSVLDGWWLEGHVEGVTGWSVGPHPEHSPMVSDTEDAESLYTKLEHLVIPKFYDERDQWVRIMRQTIAINGSFFNTHRMVEQYALTTYFL
jgi:starch phosphorylase